MTNDATAAIAKQSTREPRFNRQKARRYGTFLSSLIVLIALWWSITATQIVKPLFLPSPGAVWHAFIRANTCHPMSAGSTQIVCGEQNYFLWQHLVASLDRIGIGVGIAIVFGILLGFLMGAVKSINTVLEPYLDFLRSLPPLGYIGLLIVWFGIGDVTKVWLLFLAAFPPITIATVNGLRSVKTDRINAARSLGGSWLQVQWFVVLPSSLPSILNGIRLATGFAWTTVVAAELNNGIPGIGALAYLSGTQLQTPLTIACIIVIGIAAIALDAVIKLITRLLIPWQGRD